MRAALRETEGEMKTLEKEEGMWGKDIEAWDPQFLGEE